MWVSNKHCSLTCLHSASHSTALQGCVRCVQRVQCGVNSGTVTAMYWITLCLLVLRYADAQPFPDHIYVYGTSAGDTMAQSDRTTVDLGMEVTFGGKTFNTVHISKDGVVAFDDTVEFEAFNFTAASRDPDSDPAFIAPLYYNGQSISNQTVGKIYYQKLALSNAEGYPAVFKTYLVNATVDVEEFEPTMALIVTWENVTDNAQVESDSCNGTEGSPCQSATFQLMLVASTTETFLIISYLKMDIPVQPYYQAGINIGYGRGWTSVCPGCNLADLPTKRRSSAYGGYIFRVTKDIPERGGCSDEGGQLQIFPTVERFYGGRVLEISGPCPNPTENISCRFGSGAHMTVTEGFPAGLMTLKCPVPRLTQRGPVEVSVSVDGGNTYIGHGSIYTVMTGPMASSINLVSGWYDVTPDNLIMTWDKTALSTDPNVKVDIKLVGYRQEGTEMIWKNLATMATNADNTGTFSFKPSQYQCSPEDCDLFEVGLVEVELQSSFRRKANTRMVMRSTVVPLGWFVNNAMVEEHGTNWPPQLCTQWYNKDKVDMAWMEQLLYCPCNVGQALADFGRWQPDVGCNLHSSDPDNCFYHKGAKHCVRSFQPSSSGSGNQCCYRADGQLSYAADSYQGSTPDKSHDWGAFPYNKPAYVPSWSHWIEDVVTFYYCCLWTNYSHCDYYMEQRATRDCNGYQPSKAATAFGDPHIMTFDGKLYNFGGKGDYILLRTNTFTLQGKFKPMEADSRRYNATVLTSVAMKADNSDKIEIRLAPWGVTSGKRLDVFVNGKLKFFNSRALAKQDLNGVSVINLGITVDTTNMRQDNFTILLQSGVGVQVASSHGLLHVVVNVPPGFHSNTSGLMGTWNDDVSDDFTAMDGTIIDAASSPEDVYMNFGKTWKVARADSLFTYHNEADDNFIPIYTEPAIPSGTLTDIDDVCMDNVQCRFDYIVTGDSVIGNASRLASEWFAELQSFQRSVETCGLLDVPYATKSNTNYTFGNTVSITGCRNKGTVNGDTSYTCTKTEDGTLRWEPSVTAACKVPEPTKKPEPTSDARKTRMSELLLAVVLVIGVRFTL